MTDVRIRAGDTLSWVIRVPAGQGLDTLEGLVLRCTLRGPSGTAVLTSVVFGARDRTVAVSASAARTAQLLPGLYAVDLQLSSAGGIVRSSVSVRAQVDARLADG